MSEDENDVYTQYWRDSNKGLDTKALEQGFKNKSPQEKMDWLQFMCTQEYYEIGHVVEWKSKTADTDLENEINSNYLPKIIDLFKAIEEKGQSPVEVYEEVIRVEAPAHYNPYLIPSVGDPVNLFNGNFTYSTTDLTIVGARMDLSRFNFNRRPFTKKIMDNIR